MKECWKIQIGVLCDVLFGIGAVLSPLWHITSNDQNDAMATAFFLKRQNDGFQFALLQYIVILEI